jgi:two-component system OmpR family sensor kinase
MPIRRKLTLLYGVLLAIVGLVFGVMALSVVRWAMIDTIDTTLEDTANYIIANSNAYAVPSELGGSLVYAVVLPALDTFRTPGIYVQVWQFVDGEPEFRAASSNLGTYRDPLDSSGLGKDDSHYNNVSLNSTNWRVLTRPIKVQRTLWGNVQVTASLETVNETTNRILAVMAITTGIALIGVAGLGLWFSGRALKPIKAITRAAASIADAEDLDTRLPWDGPADELGELISVFNRMMGRLERLFKVQQRFVADVSHELRTPLTAIRGNIELIKRYGMDSASLEAIDSETERMTRMVNDLLLLTRADYGGTEIDVYPLDLDTVVSEVFQQARVLAHDRNLDIKMAFFEPVRVKGNADRIKQLLFNLVTNAIKFTPDDGTVSLGLRREHNDAIIQVSDTGIGISEHDQAYIFDRFFQVDKARSHDDPSAGAGLGLSIAKWVAEAHHGTIDVESEPGKGSTFRIHIPVIADECVPDVHDEERGLVFPRIPRIRRGSTVESDR